MKAKFKKIWDNNPKLRKVSGVVLVIIGLISVITPFTPVGFLVVVGLEILGVRHIVWDKIKSWFDKNQKED